jgi:hypothetical protein
MKILLLFLLKIKSKFLNYIVMMKFFFQNEDENASKYLKLFSYNLRKGIIYNYKMQTFFAMV